jgi:hypothetical protein
MAGPVLSRWDLLPDALIITAISLVCYVSTQYPTVSGGDSGELIAAACWPDGYGIPHPPGYPLHTLLARLMIAVLPVGSIAARVNFLSGLCSALAAAMVYCAGRILAVCALSRDDTAPGAAADTAKACIRRKRPSEGPALPDGDGADAALGERALDSDDAVADAACARWGAVLAAGLYSLSPLVWTYSTQAEVFALNNLLLSLLVLLTARFTTAPRAGAGALPLAGAFTFGLGMSNQHTIVLSAAPLALAVALHPRRSLLRPAPLATLAGCGALGLTPYLYLIAAGEAPGRGAWGDPASAAGLAAHALRRDYGTFRLFSGAGRTPQGLPALARGAALYVASLPRQGLVVAPALAAAGAGLLLRRARTRAAGAGLAAAWGVYVAAFHTLANLPLDDAEHGALFREGLFLSLSFSFLLFPSSLPPSPFCLSRVSLSPTPPVRSLTLLPPPSAQCIRASGFSPTPSSPRQPPWARPPPRAPRSARAWAAAARGAPAPRSPPRRPLPSQRRGACTGARATARGSGACGRAAGRCSTPRLLEPFSW